MVSPLKLSVLHIGSAKYRSHDPGHVAYGRRQLASGFRHYHVIGRSLGEAAEWSNGDARVTLIASHADREAGNPAQVKRFSTLAVATMYDRTLTTIHRPR